MSSPASCIQIPAPRGRTHGRQSRRAPDSADKDSQLDLNFRYTTNNFFSVAVFHTTVGGNNVSVFSVWIIPGINFCCQVSWHCAQPMEHFLFLPPSVLVAKSSEKTIRVCALALTLNSRWCQAKSSETLIATLISAPSDLECVEALSFSLSKQSSGYVLPLFSVSRWHSVPWAKGQGCVIREHPGSTRLPRAQLRAMERKDTFLLQLEALTFDLKDSEKSSHPSVPRWLGSQGCCWGEMPVTPFAHQRAPQVLENHRAH